MSRLFSSPKEVAAIVGVPLRTIHSWIQKGWIVPWVKGSRGKGNEAMIDRIEIAWAKELKRILRGDLREIRQRFRDNSIP